VSVHLALQGLIVQLLDSLNQLESVLLVTFAVEVPVSLIPLIHLLVEETVQWVSFVLKVHSLLLLVLPVHFNHLKERKIQVIV
jgi:hypothetical protein